jgi:hypothetical protein
LEEGKTDEGKMSEGKMSEGKARGLTYEALSSLYDLSQIKLSFDKFFWALKERRFRTYDKPYGICPL